MNNSDDHDDDDDVHDQLPSVEEYKATLEPGSHKIDPKRIMESVMASDSEDEDLDNLNLQQLAQQELDYNMAEEGDYEHVILGTEDDDDDDDDSYNDDDDSNSDYDDDDDDDDEEGQVIHDQLPTVEEIHAQLRPAPSEKGKGLRKCGYFICFILFLCAVILPPLIISFNTRYEKRKEDITKMLLSQNIAKSSELNDPSTPQAQALDFLAKEEFDNAGLSNDKFIERYTLTILYYSTGGPQWKFPLKFLEPVDACFWNSFFMNQNNGDISQEGAVCDDDMDPPMVKVLEMPTNNLVGTIPPEIQYLASSLEQMHLEFNPGLSGDLPFSMSLLTNLWSLELQYCSLTGVLPEWLGRDLPLRRLGLSNNLLTGTIPDTLLGQTNLVILALDDNGLKADISDFYRLDKMQFLYLEDNEIAGTLTNDLIAKWMSMKELDLSRNKLVGPLPSELFQKMINLEILDLHGNELTGAIPASIGVYNRISFMALQENKLTGEIPHNISTMIDLQHLDLSRNQISGTIPSSLGMLSFLRYLFLGSNSYNAQNIPEELMQLSALKELSLKQSNLQGSIPTTIGNLTELNLLDLDQNDLQGKLPEEVGHQLSNLDHLMLNRNKLTGTVPSSFSKLKDLELLLLDHNQLTGTADVICDAVELRYFVSDCEGVTMGNGDVAAAEFDCRCCNLCCNDFNATCNMYDWNVNLDPIWEYGYTRYVYTFSQNVIRQDDGQ